MLDRAAGWFAGMRTWMGLADAPASPAGGLMPASVPVLVPVPIRTAFRCWLVFLVFDTALLMLLFRSGFAGGTGPFIAVATFISTIAGSTARLRPRHAFAALAAAFAIVFGFAAVAHSTLATRHDLLVRVGVGTVVATVAIAAFVGITYLPARRTKTAVGAV